VCNTTEEPEIYDAKGEKIESSVIAPTLLRGQHDIENEMVFRSNTGFVFHDSRGFEAGGVDELDAVKAFIAERSQKRKLLDQLHAIWYCIPVDDSRPFTRAEINFFSECGTGHVPVIAIFTKCDALDDEAYRELEDEGIPWEDAQIQVPTRSLENFGKLHLDSLYKRRYPPKDHVYLRDMNKPDADCYNLLEKTAAALTNNVLQALFVSTQQNKLELCIRYSVTWASKKILKRGLKTFISSILDKQHHCIPEKRLDNILLFTVIWFPIFDDNWKILTMLSTIKSPELLSIIHSLAGAPPTVQQESRLCIALTIIWEHICRLPKDMKLEDKIAAAIKHYRRSPNSSAVIQAVDQVFKEDGELILKRGKEYKPKREAFGKRLTQIALDNRLSTELLNRDGIEL